MLVSIEAPVDRKQMHIETRVDVLDAGIGGVLKSVADEQITTVTIVHADVAGEMEVSAEIFSSEAILAQPSGFDTQFELPAATRVAKRYQRTERSHQTGLSSAFECPQSDFQMAAQLPLPSGRPTPGESPSCKHFHQGEVFLVLAVRTTKPDAEFTEQHVGSGRCGCP